MVVTFYMLIETHKWWDMDNEALSFMMIFISVLVWVKNYRGPRSSS